MARLQIDGHKLCHHLEELMKWRNSETFFPLYMDVSPTSACNQKCLVCYVNYLKQKVFTLEKNVFLNLMNDLGRVGVKSVCFQGTGEPLMNKYTPQAIVAGKQAGVDMALVTNGVLFTEESLNLCLSSLSWLRFSMLEVNKDLYNMTHRGKNDDWQNVVNNIKTAVQIKKQNNLDVVISGLFIVLPHNVETVLEATKMYKDLGLDYLVIKPVGQSCWNDYDFEKDLQIKYAELFRAVEAETTNSFIAKVRYDLFEEEGSTPPPKKYDKCHGLHFITQIDSDGGVYPCNNFWKMPEFSLGNIHDESFESIWTGEQKKKVFDKIFYEWDLEKCQQVCRHHVINNFLWDLSQEPQHVNFI